MYKFVGGVLLIDKRFMHNRLLELTAIAGELPYSLMPRLYGENYVQKKVSSLRASNYVKTYNRDGIRALRLTCRGRRLLLSKYPERFCESMLESKYIKPTLPHRLRLHRQCEIYAALDNAGVRIYRDEKYPLFSRYQRGPVPPGTMLFPSFYDSRDIKSIESLEEGRTKILGARFSGALYTEDAVFLCYSTGRTLMKWEYKIELRAKSLLFALSKEFFPGKYQENDIKAIMLGDKMDIASRVMSEPLRRAGKRDGFYLDGVYQNFHFITADNAGDFLLGLLCDGEQWQALIDAIDFELFPFSDRSTIENDGFDGDGNPVLFAFDFDMKRIHSFVSGVKYSRAGKGSILCFDYQADTLRQFCEDISIQIMSIDTEQARLMLRHE